MDSIFDILFLKIPTLTCTMIFFLVVLAKSYITHPLCADDFYILSKSYLIHTESDFYEIYILGIGKTCTF